MLAPPFDDVRRALVVGLGASGRMAANLLRTRGVEVVAYDRTPPHQPLAYPVVGGEAPPAAAFAGTDLVVLSPGVPPGPVRALAAQHAPRARVTGELALGLAELAARDPVPEVVLVTGTNGKSTVTALCAALVEAAGRPVFAGGNLGPPLCAGLLAPHDPPPQVWVLECSSFQLETFTGFPSRVAMVLNVTPDHLDRYDSPAAYAATKCAIFRGQGPDGLALVGPEVPGAPARARRVDPATQITATSLRTTGGLEVGREHLTLAGTHNATNALFALEAAAHLGLPAAACARGLAAFRGLPHRMQLVAEVGGVRFYDDSKATNVASVVAGLTGFERPFVLIAGGRVKPGDDPGPLLDLVRAGARGLVGIGQGGPALVAAVAGHVPAALASDMDEAVARAAALARPQDAVVLSPGGASYDMYDDFAARGRAFARAVRRLTAPARGAPPRPRARCALHSAAMSSEQEETYFLELQAEQRARLRKKLAAEAERLQARAKTAEAAGVDDEALAERIAALGFAGESAQVFDLLPLVHVAWADGKIQRGERETILEVLRRRGFEPGSEPFVLIESLLEERPAQAWLDESLQVLRELLRAKGEHRGDIAELCVAVAAVSGGVLGLGIGRTVSDEERAAIDRVLQALGAEASAVVRGELGG